MKKLLIISFLFFLLLSNCTEITNTKGIAIMEQAKELANEKMLDHFPDLNKESILQIGFLKPQIEPPNYGYLLSCTQNMSGDYINLYQELEKKSLKTIKLTDPCLIVTDKLGKGEGGYKSICADKTYPIPDKREWWGLFSGDNNYIPNDLIFFVLDAKSGKYLPDKFLTDGSGMPEIWKNGYSKGITISKEANIILFWLLIW